MANQIESFTLTLTLTGAIGQSYDFGTDANPLCHLTVTSRSWTEAVIETTKERNVYGKKVRRKPSPDQLEIEELDIGGGELEVKIILNDFIYADDVITNVTLEPGFHPSITTQTVISTITNNSIDDYPLPISTWVNHDLERVESTAHTVRLVTAHRHFEHGQLVRAVKFIATDASLNTSAVIVTSMSQLPTYVSGLSGSCFEGTLDFTGLNQGEMVTIDAIIYPWIGDDWQASVDGAVYPSPNMTVLKCLNDKTGAYGTVYAYVDGVGAGTPQVSEVAATAQANPYDNVKNAAIALQSYNNSNFGRNDVSGSVMRLEEFEHIIVAFRTVANPGDIPMLMEPADDNKQSTTIFKDAGIDTYSSITKKLKIKGITLKATADVVFLTAAATLTDGSNLIIQDCNFDGNAVTSSGSWIYEVGYLWLINCTGDDLRQGAIYGVAPCSCKSIGCLDAGSIDSGTYSVISTKTLDSFFIAGSIGDSGNKAVTDPIIAFAHIGNAEIQSCIRIEQYNLNVAVIGTVAEKYIENFPAVEVGNGSDNDFGNVVVIAHSSVGARDNVMYQDSGTVTYDKQGIFSDIISSYSWNCKTDVFNPDGSPIGNWSVVNRVGSVRKAQLRDAGMGLNQGDAGSWFGEVIADGDVLGTDAVPIIADFVNDQSLTVGGTGNGDYTPGALTALPQIPAGKTAFPFDQKGRVVPTDGTAYVGAIQFAAIADAVAIADINQGQDISGIVIDQLSLIAAANIGQSQAVSQVVAGQITALWVDSVDHGQIIDNINFSIANGKLIIEFTGRAPEVSFNARAPEINFS